MKIAIHQPNYLPWMGYFHKVAWCDVFVFLDHVQFSKGSYQNRVKIRGKGNVLWLTEPVRTAGKFGCTTDQIEFSDDYWFEKHLKTVQARYGRAPFYSEVIEQLRPMYSSGDPAMHRMNRGLIEAVSHYLGFSTRFVGSQELNVPGDSSRLLAGICNHLGANEYLAGKGAVNYHDEREFAKSGVAVRYTHFHEAVYPQISTPFEPGLSVLEVLFSLGPAAAELIKGTEF